MSQIRIPIPAVDFKPPVYICRRAEKPFQLDGNINKPFWEDAPFTDAFLDIEGSHMPVPRFLTRAKMLWDDENFYFAAQLDCNEIWGTVTKEMMSFSRITISRSSLTRILIPPSIMNLK